MPNTLDNPKTFQDKSRQLVIASLRKFPEQARLGFRDARKVRMPSSYRKVSQIVVNGMGGSTLGSDVIRSVYSPTLKLPLTIVNGYRLPASVNQKSLVVLSSYSGTTEEVLTAAKEAVRRGAKITGLTRGGALGRFFDRHKRPWYRIDGSANPAGQPRMGLGYNALGQLGLLSKAGVLPVSPQEVAAAIEVAERRIRSVDPNVPTNRNIAKRLARALYERFPILIGAGPLVGSLHAFANQLNETAKALAVSFALPELNHHLLEGLRFPRAVKAATFVGFDSDLYWPQITKRENITLEMVRKFGLKTERVRVNGPTRLAQALDVLGVAGATSFFLSVLNRVDPLSIATVNEFKRRLAK